MPKTNHDADRPTNATSPDVEGSSRPRRTVAQLFRGLDEDRSVAAAFRRDPRAVLRDHGFDIPEHVDAKVVESPWGRLHLTLEVRCEAPAERTDAEIEADRFAKSLLRQMERSATQLFGRPCPASRDPNHAHMHVVYGGADSSSPGSSKENSND